jgi:hypothetical protein
VGAAGDGGGDDEAGAGRGDLVGLGGGDDGAGADQDARVVLGARLGDRVHCTGRGQRDLERGDPGVDERADTRQRGVGSVGADDSEHLAVAEFGKQIHGFQPISSIVT